MKPLLDEQDEALWHSRAWKTYKDGYYRATINGRPVVLHRLIAGAGKGQIVDHINGNRSDNRRSNLRVCDRVGSNQNRGRRRDSAAPYKGITKPKRGRWVAQIMHEKNYIRIGSFDTAIEAARAYDAAALKLHGEYARINGV